MGLRSILPVTPVHSAPALGKLRGATDDPTAQQHVAALDQRHGRSRLSSRRNTIPRHRTPIARCFRLYLSCSVVLIRVRWRTRRTGQHDSIDTKPRINNGLRKNRTRQEHDRNATEHDTAPPTLVAHHAECYLRGRRSQGTDNIRAEIHSKGSAQALGCPRAGLRARETGGGGRPARFCQEETHVLAEQFSTTEYDWFHGPYLS